MGAKHEFSAGLLVGGKDVAEEQSRISSLNILVATPGRLLQHMDETAGFDCSGVKILVLDEADRILDLVSEWHGSVCATGQLLVLLNSLIRALSYHPP